MTSTGFPQAAPDGENCMKKPLNPRRQLMAGSAIAALTIAATATPALAVVPNETTTSTDIIDTENEFPGVGVIVTNQPGTFGIGICTASLINPRTVLFAAHCVNDVPETTYDGEQLRAVVSFNVNALPGIQSWFSTGRTNTALSAFNVNRIFYDSRSLEDAAGGGFLEADIALASLDTPAAGILGRPAGGRSAQADRPATEFPAENRRFVVFDQRGVRDSKRSPGSWPCSDRWRTPLLHGT